MIATLSLTLMPRSMTRYLITDVVDKHLGVIDMTASVMCMENKMPLMVFGLNEKDSIVNALSGKFNGTIVTVE